MDSDSENLLRMRGCKVYTISYRVYVCKIHDRRIPTRYVCLNHSVLIIVSLSRAYRVMLTDSLVEIFFGNFLQFSSITCNICVVCMCVSVCLVFMCLWADRRLISINDDDDDDDDDIYF